MSALMGLKNIFVYTHDSIGQGEDGPTHQPIEQLANLRMTPNLTTWRPCDATETAVAWKMAISQKSPSALVFSRQNLPHQHRDTSQLKLIEKGGYILKDSLTKPELILISTGSEIDICIHAAQQLENQGIATRVVSCLLYTSPSPRDS